MVTNDANAKIQKIIDKARKNLDAAQKAWQEALGKGIKQAADALGKTKKSIKEGKAKLKEKLKAEKQAASDYRKNKTAAKKTKMGKATFAAKKAQQDLDEAVGSEQALSVLLVQLKADLKSVMAIQKEASRIEKQQAKLVKAKAKPKRSAKKKKAKKRAMVVNGASAGAVHAAV